MRHGLLAKCVVLPEEAGELFEAMLCQHLDRFQPADGVEFAMVEDLASAYWRMRRAWAVETAMIGGALHELSSEKRVRRTPPSTHGLVGVRMGNSQSQPGPGRGTATSVFCRGALKLNDLFWPTAVDAFRTWCGTNTLSEKAPVYGEAGAAC
jgi:hypothetical protein